MNLIPPIGWNYSIQTGEQITTNESTFKLPYDFSYHMKTPHDCPV